MGHSSVSLCGDGAGLVAVPGRAQGLAARTADSEMEILAAKCVPRAVCPFQSLPDLRDRETARRNRRHTMDICT